jgi:NAD(P)H-quinone oxidoreductase subunit 4
MEFFLITYILCYHFYLNNQIIQLKEDYNLINFLDFHWRLRIDGLPIKLIYLTRFITTLATQTTSPITWNP